MLLLLVKNKWIGAERSALRIRVVATGNTYSPVDDNSGLNIRRRRRGAKERVGTSHTGCAAFIPTRPFLETAIAVQATAPADYAVRRDRPIVTAPA